MRQIIIIGAGGQGKVVADIIHCCGDTVVGFLDDKAPDQFPAFNIIGTFEDIGKFEQVWYFPAIGDANVRETLLKKYSDEQWYTAIHPISVIADDVMIGKGTCVMANAVINPGVIIGEGCIVSQNIFLTKSL